ncbi:MAG: threonine synthase [Thermoproteota archaeon]|nr:threonine synthase [Thermoproteota archaeon]
MWQYFNETPLVRLERLSDSFHLQLYGKIEIMNPTGSHKDRESIMVVSDAIKQGFSEVGCASTGNAAISISAYAYISGLKCDIYVSKNMNSEKMALIKMFKPNIHVIEGDYSEAIEVSNRDFKEKEVYNANPGQCSAKLRGNAEIGKEIAQQISPNYVICPTNNGTHFTGVWTGLKEAGKKPRMIAATAQKTEIADSIQGFHRIEGKTFDEALNESNGIIVDVSDDEIIQALRMLYKEGIVAEPASAASIATIQHLEYDKDEIVCCTITGSGLKFPKLIEKII